MKKGTKRERVIFYLVIIFCCCCIIYYFSGAYSTPKESAAPEQDGILEEENLQKTGEEQEVQNAVADGDTQEDVNNPDNQGLTAQDPARTQDFASPPEDSELIELISILQSPLPGAKVTNRDTQLPGALRDYRNGTHEGLDLYDGYCSIPIHYGDPVYAAGDGVIERIDHNYVELITEDRDEMLRICAELPETPADYLDLLRGRQVWIRHPNGIRTYYAHLSNTADLEEGDQVKAGDLIGEIGNSGTSDGALGNKAGAHLHFEVWIGDNYLGKGLPASETRRLLKVIFEK